MAEKKEIVNSEEKQWDFMELWQEKLFLGQEFLTWLWLSSEHDNRLLTLGDKGEVELWFENRLQLDSGQGSSRRSVSCSTPQAGEDEWAEAYAALRENKKVVRGRLRIRTKDSEWAFTLASDTLTPQGVKMTIMGSAQEDEASSLSGRFLERASLLIELLGLLEELFVRFLKVRLDAGWARKELPRLRAWILERSSS